MAFYRDLEAPCSQVTENIAFESVLPASVPQVERMDEETINEIEGEAEASFADENDFEDHWLEFSDMVYVAKEKLSSNWNNNLKKAFASFKKKFRKAFNANENTLIRKLYDFGVEKRRKTSYLIPVNSTSLARRKYPHRGRGRATLGRRPKTAAKRSQMFVDQDNDEGIVYHSIPRKKARYANKEHNLGKAVRENRNNAKKH